MYFASDVDAAVVGCSLLFQLTTPPLSRNTYLVVDLLLSRSPAKSESQ
jgi:hypothetical protein